MYDPDFYAETEFGYDGHHALAAFTGNFALLQEEAKMPPRRTWLPGLFESFQRKRPEERVIADHKRLTGIFNQAASPTTQAALDWGLQNGVTFFIDHQMRRAAAYYTVGTGVVGLAARYATEPEVALPFIVHEIRHAWQDVHGLIPTIGLSFTDYFIRLALAEADAFAYETLSRHEECGHYMRKDPKLGVLKWECANPKSVLRKAFKDWGAERGETYGETAARHFACKLGVPGVTPTDYNMEFNPFNDRDFFRRGVDIDDVESILPLGGAFDAAAGKRAGESLQDYLQTPGMQRFIGETMMDADRAARFYGGHKNLPPLVREVNRYWRRAQRAHEKRGGGDLYL